MNSPEVKAMVEYLRNLGGQHFSYAAELLAAYEAGLKEEKP